MYARFFGWDKNALRAYYGAKKCQLCVTVQVAKDAFKVLTGGAEGRCAKCTPGARQLKGQGEIWKRH